MTTAEKVSDIGKEAGSKWWERKIKCEEQMKCKTDEGHSILMHLMPVQFDSWILILAAESDSGRKNEKVISGTPTRALHDQSFLWAQHL